MIDLNEEITEENVVRISTALGKQWVADGSLNDFFKKLYPNGIPSSIVSSVSNEDLEEDR